MKITAQRTDLLNALAIAKGATPSRTPKEILKSVKLVASDGLLTLIANDSEIEQRTSVPVEVSEPGECLVGDKLLLICREATGTDIEIEAANGFVDVACGFANWKLQTQDVKEFPEFTLDVDGSPVTLDLERLQWAIGMTAFACDPESQRFALGGVYFELEQESGCLTLVATDSRRLSVAHVGKVDGHVRGNETGVIPIKACQMVGRMAGEGVALTISENAARFAGDGWTVTTKLISGRFPQYRQVLPKDDGTTRAVDIVVPVSAMARAIRQSQVVQDSENGATDMRFHRGNLTMTASGASTGSAKAVMPIQYEGADVNVTFESRYLMDFLKRLPADESVEVSIQNKESAAMMSCGGVVYLVMPRS